MPSAPLADRNAAAVPDLIHPVQVRRGPSFRIESGERMKIGLTQLTDRGVAHQGAVGQVAFLSSTGGRVF